MQEKKETKNCEGKKTNKKRITEKKKIRRTKNSEKN